MNPSFEPPHSLRSYRGSKALESQHRKKRGQHKNLNINFSLSEVGSFLNSHQSKRKVFKTN